nr:MAG TPA: hypothetical protein [Caudoviricetes sp.]
MRTTRSRRSDTYLTPLRHASQSIKTGNTLETLAKLPIPRFSETCVTLTPQIPETYISKLRNLEYAVIATDSSLFPNHSEIYTTL